MPIKDAGKKAMRTDAKKRVKNLKRSNLMKDLVKKTQKLITTGDKKGAEEMLPKVQKAIDKAQKAGILKPNTAARKKSRLIASVKKIS